MQWFTTLSPPPLGNVPKIHPFWWRHRSLNEPPRAAKGLTSTLGALVVITLLRDGWQYQSKTEAFLEKFWTAFDPNPRPSEWSLSLEIMCMYFILSGPHTHLHKCKHIWCRQFWKRCVHYKNFNIILWRWGGGVKGHLDYFWKFLRFGALTHLSVIFRHIKIYKFGLTYTQIEV